jgi:hypothetical protein
MLDERVNTELDDEVLERFDKKNRDKMATQVPAYIAKRFEGRILDEAYGRSSWDCQAVSIDRRVLKGMNSESRELHEIDNSDTYRYRWTI